MTSFLKNHSFPQKLFRLLVLAICLFLGFQFVSLFLSWPKQIVLGSVSIFVVLLLNRASKSHIITLTLMLLSLAATLRYSWWRVHLIYDFFNDESNHRVTVDAVLMLILLSAEAYTVLIMLFGFMQTAWPLRRPPIPLPADESLWPHVDVLIPTYNEPLSLVRYTALAAINIDYPPEKLHVYILDDGTRPAYRQFCEDADIGYVVRETHSHAKAGNINHALGDMTSPLIAIFDCDHVPTRSFLQVTAGWFLADEKLAMLQTPHYFYSPDPFERNLSKYSSIPNEGELFYGVIQDGNDLWNATFFCGSCAVIRRAALMTVGGIATETVTEDAHTSLRMQKKGWGTAYINLPQAAGLATETLSAHVGQRIRWARGMIQILRTDNPMLASGMKFTQRLCYFNAMLHFMYAVPRLIFLCAPLVYMLGGMTIIPGYWVAILAYAMPHLVMSSITNSRVQGRHRHSFWNEIYETVLAPYILMPTLLALINPKLGKFNVTDKGNTLAETRFDRSIAAPTAWLLGLNFLGICAVPYRLMVTDPTHPGTVLSNLLWIFFNMVILGVAAAVANEQKQRRTSVRIPARLVIRLQPKDGQRIEAYTVDMSVGGASISLPNDVKIAVGEKLQVAFPHQTGDAEIPATVAGRYHNNLRLKFENLSIDEEETLTRALYSRADSWVATRANVEEDRPLVSLGRVIMISFTGFYQVVRGLFSSGKSKAAAVLFLGWLALTPHLLAQFPGALPAPPPPSRTFPTPAQPGAGPFAQPASQANAAQPILTNAPADPTQAAAAAVPDATNADASSSSVPGITEDVATDKLTLKDLGVDSSIEMHGPHQYYSLGFVLSNSRIPRKAQINLAYHFSASLAPRSGSIKVMVNSTQIGEIPAPAVAQREGAYDIVSFNIPAELLIRNNDLTFEFTGRSTQPRSASSPTPALANIGATSTILIVGDPVPVRKDLSLLPLPLFDSDLQTTTTIPFVFPSSPTPRMLEAAAVVASWFGIQASSKPIHFSVAIGPIPAGNVVIFANAAADLAGTLGIPTDGPSLSIKANPSDPNGSALVLAGSSDDQVLAVARSLALTPLKHPQPDDNVTPLGETVRIGDFALPPERKPDDAPRWLPTGDLRSLYVNNSADSMNTNGSKPIPIYLKLPPDLFYGETQNLNLNLTYRYNALPVAAGSAMRVYMNGTLVNEAPLPPGTDFSDRRRTVLVPTEKMRPFGNTLIINFDFVPANPNDTRNDPVHRLQGEILRGSALDIRHLAHYAPMPNLELFANAGFPFTRLADLSDTTVIMPATPSPKEIALLLYLASHFGTQTGYPSLRIDIAGPDAAMKAGRDYLILGNIASQPVFNQLDTSLPVTLDANGVHVKPVTDRFAPLWALWRQITGSSTIDDAPTNEKGLPDVMIEGIQSPADPSRSVVIVALRYDEAVDKFADVFLERSQSSDISQTVSILRGTAFSSYSVPGKSYHVGYISGYSLMRIWLAQYFWLLLLVVTLFCMLMAVWIREYLEYLAATRLKAAEKPL